MYNNLNLIINIYIVSTYLNHSFSTHLVKLTTFYTLWTIFELIQEADRSNFSIFNVDTTFCLQFFLFSQKIYHHKNF